MHARDLMELAATVVQEAGRLLSRGELISEQALYAYWIASRMRQERWAQHFKAYGIQLQKTPPPLSHEAWRPLRPVLDEILLSEALTRVVAAALSQCDPPSVQDAARPSSGRCHPMVHAVFLGHLEARHRALNLMNYGQGFSDEEGAMMNRLRRRCEHWSDLLLAGLVSQCDTTEYAVDFQRVRRLATELGYQGTDVTRSPTWQWIRAAMRAAFFRGSTSLPSPIPIGSLNAELNHQIAASVLAWLGNSGFDSWGAPHSPWISRLPQVDSDRRLLEDEFFGKSLEIPERSGPGVPPYSRFDRPNSDSHAPRFGRFDHFG